MGPLIHLRNKKTAVDGFNDEVLGWVRRKEQEQEEQEQEQKQEEQQEQEEEEEEQEEEQQQHDLNLSSGLQLNGFLDGRI